MSTNGLGSLIARWVADALEIDVDALDLDRPLEELGLDSMLAVSIAQDVRSKLEVDIPVTLLLEAGTVEKFVTELRDVYGAKAPARDVGLETTRPLSAPPAAGAAGSERPAAPGPERPVAMEPERSATAATEPERPTAGVTRPVLADPTDESDDLHDMAIVGYDGVFPGAASISELWRVLISGEDCLREVPEDRWNIDDYHSTEAAPGTVYLRRGGFVDDLTGFDAAFFRISPAEARWIDPQQRHLIQSAWRALEDAGLAGRCEGRSVGVFVGASYQHYRDLVVGDVVQTPAGLGNHNAILANRVSFFLDLRGPSMTIDTLCSSSLVALHTAVRSIRNGECEIAIVAGVHMGMSPQYFQLGSRLRSFSPTGASRAFDASADGFVPGEGVVTVVVKPLRAAVADGDRIRGVIRGTAVNHGGRTSGLTVPNGSAQFEVIVAALRDAGVDPGSIELLEAHGTGTSLGDPIEVEGLTRAWRGFTSRRQFCAIGSLKSNVGHLEPAAGLAGLVKVLLAMEHERIPPTLHVRRPNDHIRFEETPFYVVDRPVVWSRGGRPRLAAVSAFGMGGVNAHVVVQEPPVLPVRGRLVQDSFLVKVTGATEQAVRQLAAAYADRFAGSRDEWETADLCHTANVGRSTLEYRTAVAGRDAAELAEALRAVAAGALPVARAVDTASPPAGRRAEDVAEAVRAGYTQVDWASFSAPGARVTDLPTYPFAPERYWHRRPAPTPYPVGDVRNGAGPVATSAADDLPEATRVGWRREELAVPTVREPLRVRVLAPAPMAQAVTGALRETGLSVVADTGSADAVVVVDQPDDEPTADLSGFWADLRSLLASLPAHGRLIWAGHRFAAVATEERASLVPRTAAEAAAVRAACAENRLARAVVDLDPTDPVEARARHLAAEVAALRPGTDTVAAYRAGSRFVPAMVPAAAGGPVELASDGYYLVTGGLGAVGRRLVGQLVECGARHVGIVGRSRPGAEAEALLRDLAGRAEVEYRSCDVTDDGALRAAAAAFTRRWGRLRGVVHCSGSANRFGSTRRHQWADAASVIAPKVAGSLNVVRLARSEGAEFVVLVSSIAGTMPEAGRGLVDYALANAYQLALAERETGAGMVVTAHAWPAWTGVGMRADVSFAAAHAISPEQALRAFTAYLRVGGSVVFPGSATEASADPDSAPVTVPREASGALVGLVRDAFRDVLGEDPGDRAVAELGLDSLAIADLAAALERRSGRPVLPSIIMRAKTVDDIAAALAPARAEANGAAALTAVIPAPRPPADDALSDLLRPLLAEGRES